MWERFGAHGDLQAVFDSDPPQSVLDEFADVDDVLDMELVNGFEHRERRGSRSMSEASGIFHSRSRSMLNGFRGRGMREEFAAEMPVPDGDGGEV
jgi:hypothetical protein